MQRTDLIIRYLSTAQQRLELVRQKFQDDYLDSNANPTVSTKKYEQGEATVIKNQLDSLSFRTQELCELFDEILMKEKELQQN